MFDPAGDLKIKHAEGAAWAADEKCDDLRKAVRARFGGGLVFLDYNRDGKLDVLLTGAVVRGGEIRDVLLRNDGNNSFTDVTAEAGLGNHPGSFGAAVGDFDNDSHPDLALAGPAGLRLFRNAGGKFEDKTAAAGTRQGARGVPHGLLGRSRPGRRPRPRRREVRRDPGTRPQATPRREGRGERPAGVFVNVGRRRRAGGD